MGSLNLIHLIQMALGVGMVIFVHEAGHFIMARLCGVRVDVFSLGFGPKLIGWTRGTTLYQIAALPFGGYVRMAGEDPFDAGGEGDGEGRPAADDLRSKTVGQRFLIYSGGVIMNVVFAMVVFPAILYLGVPFTPPVIGDLVPGSVAWRAGIEPGSKVLSVNGNSIIDFNFIPHEVALGPPDATRIEYQPPGADTPRTVVLNPEYNDFAGINTVGVRPPVDPEGRIQVEEGSPAWQAGLRTDDMLIAVEGPLPELPLLQQLRYVTGNGDPLVVRVEREGQVIDVSIEPTRGQERPVLGVQAVTNRVEALRPNATLQAWGLAPEDRIIEVNGRPIQRPRDLELALALAADPITAVIERGSRTLTLEAPGLERAEAIAVAADIAIAADVDSNRVLAMPDSPLSRAGLLDGDRILRIDGSPTVSWDQIYEHSSRAAATGAQLELSIERIAEDGGKQLLALSATPAPWGLPTYGLDLRLALYEYRAGSVGEAFRVGIQGSWKFLVDAWNALKRIVMGQVGAQNIGGPISIGVVSYSWASLGIAKLLFFLCMLSMNLAFLNVLPIPVLDGGHLLFLLIEKVKGSPVSDRVFGYSQLVGIVLILSLMIFVTFNDLRRWTGLFGD